jgi:2-aminoadipate transaminase
VASSPVRELLALLDRPEVVSFAGGLPAPELFDLDGVRTAYDTVLWGSSARRALQYAPTEGDRELRARVAARMTARGLLTGVDDLLVTTGSQQALTLVATALLDPGAVVLVEDPTYLAALQCFQLAGARASPCPPTSTASTRSRWPTSWSGSGRRCSTWSRRSPTPPAAPCRRTAGPRSSSSPPGTASGWSRTTPTASCATGAPRCSRWPRTQGADGHVLHSAASPRSRPRGLRLGWLRAPSRLLPALTVAKQAADLHTSTVDQAAAAAWFGAADVAAHVARLCSAYRARRDALVEALPAALPAGSTWTDPDGGMFVWVRLPGTPDTADLLRRALAHDVAFVPGAAFYAGTPDRATLRLSFTTNTPERIAEGVSRLGAVLTED